ncbi:MAG: FAD-dependent oxidoreductase [Hyphomicrobiaceae bacterium]|nr:FAD-dependent oxidoreductase [Hyphomicrobiaceae bacterium]
MVQKLTPDLCVIGAGSGGLSVAAAGAQLGADVVLIEKAKMGGDCLNTGCVPSKALLAAAKRAHQIKTSDEFGIKGTTPQVDFAKVLAHVKNVIAQIAPNDSVERFSGLGVQVIEAAGSFRDRKTVVAGDYEIKARRFVIATGSTAALPPISGLDQVPYLTNENIFDLTELPTHLIVIGGGPIGMEMAQAFSRLGSKVTVLEAFTPFAKDDPEAAAVVMKQLTSEGIEILANARVERVEETGGELIATVSMGEVTQKISGSHLLVAAGRRPVIDGLELEKAGIDADPRGIKVATTLLTTNKKVFAIGDVTGGMQFTHMANYQAGIVIRRALFKLPAKATSNAVPWVTYTDPELAQVGMSEAEAQKAGHTIRILRFPYAENDRAISEHHTNGFIKAITDKKGRILGATIVGLNAGEIIQMWTFAITQKMKIKAMTEFISPYPTLSEISKRAAYTYFTSSLTSPMLHRIIRWLGKLG